MTPETRKAAAEYALAEFPREACGLVVVVKGRERFWPCRNISDAAGDQFAIAPGDYAAAEDAGEIVAIFHSHVNLPPDPSGADRSACEATGVPWYIIGVPSLAWAEIEPVGFEAPLVGRQHVWGRMDCWTLVRDWYRCERGVTLIDKPRTSGFWRSGEDIIGGNIAAAGFVALDESAPLEIGDLILTQTGDSEVPNHVALYLGDDLILHHAEGRLSSRDIYGGWLKKHTVKVVRYANDQA